MRLKRCIACSRRRNGRCEFSTRLLSHLPVCCFSRAPSFLKAARCEAIRDDGFRFAVSLHQFLEGFQCCSFFSAFGKNGFHYFAFGINSPLEIVVIAIRLHENLVCLPFLFGASAQLLNTLPSDLSNRHRAKPVPLIPDSFVAHVDASLVPQTFDIPKRKRETDVQHHRKADDLGAGFEVLERGRSSHRQLFLKSNGRPQHNSNIGPQSGLSSLVQIA